MGQKLEARGREARSKVQREEKGQEPDTAELLASCFGCRIVRAREAAIEPPSCEGIMPHVHL